jgi:hypothetical protein
METVTGLKLVLNSDPDSVGIDDLMRSIFSIYVETVLKNPFIDVSQKIQSELFHAKLDDVVKSHHCYT